ncbi:MAG: class I SAM-dependent methyltransferase [Elusimicrobia bacterium]|nr:class I SAM-dependent methyltransferase [Elusimicrobiota bacterium]
MSDLRARMEAWAKGLDVAIGDAQWTQLETFLREVETYNAKVNITADAGDLLWRRHAADGLAALPVLRRALDGLAAPNILDLGAGAGFVGMTLKIFWPEASVTFLESSRRKFQFLNWISAQMKFKGLHVAYGKAPEALGPKRYEAVVVRAVAALPETIRMSAPLLDKEHGLLVVYQTEQPNFDSVELKESLKKHGARLRSIQPYRLPGEPSDRHLVLLDRAA